MFKRNVMIYEENNNIEKILELTVCKIHLNISFNRNHSYTVIKCNNKQDITAASEVSRDEAVRRPHESIA